MPKSTTIDGAPKWATAATAFATLYVGAGAAAIVALRGIGWEPVVFLLGIVWAGDSAAYYAGTRFGKRRLAPVVSPKKSWEGFWGQVIAGALFGALLALLLPRLPGEPPVAIAVGTEQLGLSEKWMKRASLRVKIPMLGVADSLNVAQATTLLLYEVIRQRRQ